MVSFGSFSGSGLKYFGQPSMKRYRSRYVVLIENDWILCCFGQTKKKKLVAYFSKPTRNCLLCIKNLISSEDNEFRCSSKVTLFVFNYSFGLYVTDFSLHDYVLKITNNYFFHLFVYCFFFNILVFASFFLNFFFYEFYILEKVLLSVSLVIDKHLIKQFSKNCVSLYFSLKLINFFIWFSKTFC